MFPGLESRRCLWIKKVKRGKCQWLTPGVQRKRSQGQEGMIGCRKRYRKRRYYGATENQVQDISSLVCGRAAIECQGEGKQKREKARGLELIRGEIEVYRERCSR